MSRRRMFFDNGYGISIISEETLKATNPLSMLDDLFRGMLADSDTIATRGTKPDDDTFEIAVLVDDGEGGAITYDTDIHDRLLPYGLSESEVQEYIERVKSLPKRETDTNGK